jgi:single-stranded-DNA-specific exonuclease
VIEPRRPWLLPEPIPEPPVFAGFGPAVGTLLARRGIWAQADLDRFLGGGIVHPLDTMADAELALARIERALEHGERIAIWGDYDADGMTAVAVWTLALRALGTEPVRYVPSRLAEGYGLSVSGLRSLRERGVDLVVTCDCGVVNVDEVDAAAARGLDVIVTDHHLPAAVLPRAVAVVDPHRVDCHYPDPDMTGAGLAWKLASVLVERRGLAVPDLAGIAAIGTIADVAPMTGESRVIVQRGLAELGRTQRAGLRALLARACEHPEAPTAREIGMSIAPRINAAGRIAEAELAMDLLVEEDPARAEILAEELEGVHRRRRELTATAVEAAGLMVEQLPDGTGPLALRHDDWPAGIVGLVAGRLADRLRRPVAAVTLVGDELRGSVRAPADFHVAQALAACAGHLAKRGGHAAAGGFSCDPAAWDAFVAAWRALPPQYGDAQISTVAPDGGLVVDLVVPARLIGWPLIGELERLAPYGPGHPEPLLAFAGLTVGDARRVGADGRHLSLRMRRGAETIDAVAFGHPNDGPLPEAGDAVDLVGTLERDVWQGEQRLRIRIVDLAHAGASPLRDRRRIAIPVGPPAAIVA